MITRVSDNSVRICCGKQGCPVVEKVDDDHYKVTDDDGNTILVKKEELKLMGDAVNTIDGNEELLCGWFNILYISFVWSLLYFNGG